MKIKLLCAGKTTDSYIKEGIEKFTKRLKHYVTFEIFEIAEVKGAGKTTDKIKEEESKLFLSKIEKADHIVLLDEKGTEYSSLEFADMLQNRMNRSLQTLVFIIGGPFGFSEEIYRIANEKMALSRMTFSHQMIRLFFVEQLYRGFSILRGEKYHHE